MPYIVPRVQIVPQPDDQVSFQVEGRERLRWHASPRYRRAFFFPLVGPSGRSLTRMGHPAAPDHDHHRSLWWGHNSVGGVDFWSETPGTQQVRQEAWVHYQDGADEAGIVVRLGWFDAHQVKLLQQEMIAVYRPLDRDEGWIEIQTRIVPTMDELTLGKTNFGLIGLRVAAPLSAHYGGGRLRNSAGGVGEAAVFAKPAAWMDYSGPIERDRWEGITWFDHPANPGSPVSWHVRDDGWMSPAFTLREAFVLKKTAPLTLRYALHVHGGDLDPRIAAAHQVRFAAAPAWEVVAARRPWRVQLRRKS